VKIWCLSEIFGHYPYGDSLPALLQPRTAEMFILTVQIALSDWATDLGQSFDKPLAAFAAAAHQWTMNKVRLHSILRVAHKSTISPRAEASTALYTHGTSRKQEGDVRAFVVLLPLFTSLVAVCARHCAELIAPASLPPHFSCLLSFLPVPWSPNPNPRHSFEFAQVDLKSCKNGF